MIDLLLLVNPKSHRENYRPCQVFRVSTLYIPVEFRTRQHYTLTNYNPAIRSDKKLLYSRYRVAGHVLGPELTPLLMMNRIFTPRKAKCGPPVLHEVTGGMHPTGVSTGRGRVLR